MLEDPSYESVVRWGNEGDSFVVLEVSLLGQESQAGQSLTLGTEREIYEVHPSQALQAQQLREFCPSVEQVRFPQS